MAKKGEKVVRPETTIVSSFTPIIEKPTVGDYAIGDKILALGFLDSTQREFNGEMVPEYSKTSQLLIIPESTLRNWWKQQASIYTLGQLALRELPNALSIKLIGSAFKVIAALEKKGYNTMGARDLNSLLNTYITKFRLLSGGSTANVAHAMLPSPIPHRGQLKQHK